MVKLNVAVQWRATGAPHAVLLNFRFAVPLLTTDSTDAASSATDNCSMDNSIVNHNTDRL